MTSVHGLGCRSRSSRPLLVRQDGKVSTESVAAARELASKLVKLKFVASVTYGG